MTEEEIQNHKEQMDEWWKSLTYSKKNLLYGTFKKVFEQMDCNHSSQQIIQSTGNAWCPKCGFHEEKKGEF